MFDTKHLDAIAGIVGPKGLLTRPEDMAAYEQGARSDRGCAAFVARPATTSETSQLVAYCVQNAIHLIPQSGNTGLVAGSGPDRTGQQGVLSLDRLTGHIEIDRLNRSARAGAGTTLSDLNSALQAQGLCFPIDLGANPRLGGMLSTNTGGARFLRYGDVRRNTLGLTVVLGDENGTILRLGSGIRKDNTGIDWKQAFIGTSGAFGVITECCLNVEPLARQSATVLLVPAFIGAVPEILLSMETAFGADLTAFESMSGNAIRAALDHVPSLRNPFPRGDFPDFVILAEISRSSLPRSGEPSLDARLEDVLSDMFESDAGYLADALVGPPQDLWALRHAVPEGVKYAGRLVGFDLAFLRGDIFPFLERMKTEVTARHPEATICDFGHVGDGGVHFNLVFPHDDARFDDPQFERHLRQWVYETVVQEFGGSYSAEHAIGRRNQAYYDAYTKPELRRLSRDLKAVLSPGPIGAANL